MQMSLTGHYLAMMNVEWRFIVLSVESPSGFHIGRLKNCWSVMKMTERYIPRSKWDQIKKVKHRVFKTIFGCTVKLKFHTDAPCWACFTDDIMAVLFAQGFTINQCLHLAPMIRDLVKREMERDET